MRRRSAIPTRRRGLRRSRGAAHNGRDHAAVGAGRSAAPEFDERLPSHASCRLRRELLTWEGPDDTATRRIEDRPAGAWAQEGRPSLRRQYPDSLTFSTGTYRGARGDQQGFIWWDAGIYRMEGERRLLLSTASDELTALRGATARGRPCRGGSRRLSLLIPARPAARPERCQSS